MAGKSEGNTRPKKAAAGKRAYGLLGKSGFVAAATIDGMPDGVVLVDMSGKIIYVNKAFERMLGFRADELIGASALELPTYRKSKDRVKAREYLLRMIGKGGAEHIDMSAITRDGREVPINFTASVIRDPQGNPEAMVAVIRDISERKSAEEALRDSEELSRGMLEAASTGIYLLQDGCFRYVNRLFEEIAGYANSELKGKYSLDYVHPEDREEVRKKAVEVLKGQSILPYEFKLIRKDSEIVWVLDRVASIQYKGKRSVLGTLMDITESKQVEEEVRHYTRQLEALFNIGTTVSQTLNLEELLGNVLDKVLEVMGVEVTAIFLLEDESGTLALRAYRGMSAHLVRELSVLRGRDGFINRVAKSGKPLLVADVSAGKRFSKSKEKTGGIQAFAVVPVMSKEKILGVIGVGSNSHREFPDWEVRMLETIANQIGMANENARLYEHALELAFTDSLTGF